MPNKIRDWNLHDQLMNVYNFLSFVVFKSYVVQFIKNIYKILENV